MPDWEIIEYQDLKVAGYEDEFEIIDIDAAENLEVKEMD